VLDGQPKEVAHGPSVAKLLVSLGIKPGTHLDPLFGPLPANMSRRIRRLRMLVVFSGGRSQNPGISSSRENYSSTVFSAAETGADVIDEDARKTRRRLVYNEPGVVDKERKVEGDS
jgi:hypothetical protein